MSVNGVNAVGGDKFISDNKVMDLQTLIMTIQTERAEGLEKQLADQAAQMKELNARISTANDMLIKARTQKNAAGDKTSWGGNDMENWRKKEGIQFDTKGNDVWHSKDEWDINIEAIKRHVDELNSTSQMEMIRLQGLMNKRNQAYELMTNSLQKLSGALDKVLGNMR